MAPNGDIPATNTERQDASAPQAAGQPSPWTLVAFGDSLTATRGPLRIYSAILQETLSCPDRPVRVVNAGIGGHTTADGRLRFERDVLAHQPRAVIILFGANDAAVDVWKDPPPAGPRVALSDYEANLRHFVRTLRRRGARVILATPPPFRWTDKMIEKYGKPPYNPADPDGFDLLLRDYAAAVRRLAAEEKAVLADTRAAFEAYGRQPGQSLDDLYLDGMHPNEKGQRVLADVLLGCLRNEVSGVGFQVSVGP